jgi:hypothetical protein
LAIGVQRIDAVLDAGELIAARLRGIDVQPLKRSFAQHGAFLYLPQFLSCEITAQLVAAADAVTGTVNRNYLPRHKQGGSVSRYKLDLLAPFVGALYRSPRLIAWLQELVGEPLQTSPADDPHAYALYFYTRPGDHIGWHYDRSYYAGRRYTALLGVLDESSCLLQYQLHTRANGTKVESGAIKIPPGGLVFFDGDKLRHRITPLGPGERRISLTLEYVTDPTMRPWGRFVSNMKDAIAYFGFREIFSRQVQRIKRERSADARQP